jgi:hypothetical protein
MVTLGNTKTRRKTKQEQLDNPKSLPLTTTGNIRNIKILARL